MILFENHDQRMEFLKKNPIFWSLFGHESKSGNWDVHQCNAQRHKAMFDQGILVHSSVIPSGWVGPDAYDYTELDRLLEMLFTAAPEILFLPRVKLNVPKGWCRLYPEDVFVYSKGPCTREEILAAVDTEVHGSHPSRKTDKLALQSLSSDKWLEDASQAMKRFVDHLENSPWADHIIGYHVAYGTCGESTKWGSWNKDPLHQGDYGINHTKAFISYGADRGITCTEVPPVSQRFFIGDNPVPGNRVHIGTPTLEQLFFHETLDQSCIVYSQFERDINVRAIETLCKAVKEQAPEKLTGVFYGYVTEPDNCANGQHTGFDKILSSPYVDFLAGPKGYTRVGPLDPGLGQAVPNSVNRKKLWVDEIDNRTHLSTWSGSKDHPAKNFDQTRAVYWREFTKNVVFHQAYWWMDLGGGWLDSQEIRDEIRLLNETAQKLYEEKENHRSLSQVLLVMDENCLHYMRPNFNLHRDVIHHTGSVIKECGVPIDLYRLSDLQELDLSGYKMIVFLNAFCVDHREMTELLHKTAPDCHILWNYTAGILDSRTGNFGLENVYGLTGFQMGEYAIGSCAGHEESCYPVPCILPDAAYTALDHFADGVIRVAKRMDDFGRTHILDAMPQDMTPERMQQMLREAGVHIFAPAYCVVHTDNRFLYVLAERKMKTTLKLREPVTCRNEFTGEIFRNTDTIVLEMEEGTCAFLRYLKEG